MCVHVWLKAPAATNGKHLLVPFGDSAVLRGASEWQMRAVPCCSLCDAVLVPQVSLLVKVAAATLIFSIAKNVLSV